MRQTTHWPAVVTAMAAGIVSGATISKISLALPLLKAEFGMSLIAAGWLVSTFNTIALVGAIFFGLICDRAGALRFCLFGLGCMVAGGTLGAAAPSAAWLITSRVIEGAGYVTIAVSAPVLVASASAPAQRGLAFGLWGAHMPTGAVAVLLASPVLFALFGWRAVWICVALVAALVMTLLAIQRGHYAGTQAGAPRSLADIRATLARPVPWLLGLAFAAYTLQFYAVLMWLPTYLLQTRSASAETSALFAAMFVLANACGNVTGGWLMHRNVPLGRICAVSFAVTSVIFLGIFAEALPDAARGACVLAYGFITGVIPPAIFNGGLRQARSPAEAGSIQGLIVQLSNVGIFSGPPLIAAAVTRGGGWHAALWVILAAAAVGLTAALGVSRLEGRDLRPEPPLPTAAPGIGHDHQH